MEQTREGWSKRERDGANERGNQGQCKKNEDKDTKLKRFTKMDATQLDEGQAEIEVDYW